MLPEVKRAPDKPRWKLSDLIDFENWLPETGRWRKAWRSGVREELSESDFRSEKARRRSGFRLLLEAVRNQEKSHPGEQVESASRLAGMVLSVLMFLLGIGVVRGLLVPFSYQDVSFEGKLIDVDGRGFNVWIFLMITLGVQWVFLLAGLLGYVLWRRWAGTLSWLQVVFAAVVRKLSGGNIESDRWRGILRSGAGKVWGWRITRMLQLGGVGYNLGLLVGLFGCLMFLNVGFYWETTLPQFGEKTLQKTTQVLSLHTLSTDALIEETQLGYQPSTDLSEQPASTITPRMRQHMRWASFFFLVLVVWGLLPRVIFWMAAMLSERRALAALEFKESHHRKLWRELTSVSRGEVTTTQSDGVVVLDVGGIEISNDDLRPYLLQELRVNPEKRFSLGTLDEAESQAAMGAARMADSGVVFLVEGWSLSPKQMSSYHEEVREAIGDHMIRYVMIGSEDELQEWVKFTDGLRDSECEIHRYEKR